MNNKKSSASKSIKNKIPKNHKNKNDNHSISNETLTQISSIASDGILDRFRIRDSISRVTNSIQSTLEQETEAENETDSENQRTANDTATITTDSNDETTANDTTRTVTDSNEETSESDKTKESSSETTESKKIKKVIDYIKYNKKADVSLASSSTDKYTNSSYTVMRHSKMTQKTEDKPDKKSQSVQTKDFKRVHIKSNKYPEPTENFEYLHKKKENQFLLYDVIEDTNLDILNFLNDFQREDCLEKQVCDTLDELIYQDKQKVHTCGEDRFKKPKKYWVEDRSDQIPTIDANATVKNTSKTEESSKYSKKQNSFGLPNGTTINIPIYNGIGYQQDQTPMFQSNNIPFIQPTQIPMVQSNNIPFIRPTQIPMAQSNNIPFIRPTQIPMVQSNNIPFIRPTQYPICPPYQYPIIEQHQYPTYPRFQPPYQSVRIPNPNCKIHGSGNQKPCFPCPEQPNKSQKKTTELQKNDNMQDFCNLCKSTLRIGNDIKGILPKKHFNKAYKSRHKYEMDYLTNLEDFNF